MAASAFWMTVWALGADPADRDRDPLSDLFVAYLPRFLAIGALLTAVGEFYRGEVRSLEAMRAAEADRTVLEQQTLQARLRHARGTDRAHFLFNTLANVRRLYETDHATGEAMLERLMRYLQVALPSMRDDRSTLEREGQLITATCSCSRCAWGGAWSSHRHRSGAAAGRGAADDAADAGRERDQAWPGAAARGRPGRGRRASGRATGFASKWPIPVAASVAIPRAAAPGSRTSGRGSRRCSAAAADFTLAARQPCGLLATIRIPITVRAVAA
jgi:hypothetical protein